MCVKCHEMRTCHVTLTKLWPHDLKVDHFTSYSTDHLCQFVSKVTHSFSKYRVDNFAKATQPKRVKMLTFDLLIAKVDRFMPSLSCANLQSNQSICFQNTVLTSSLTDITNGRMKIQLGRPGRGINTNLNTNKLKLRKKTRLWYIT